MTGGKLSTVADLLNDLRALGVRSGETLMLHASLRAIGPIEGGATGVLDALDEAVGPDGTLLMILGAVVDHEWVNARPEAERAALLEGVPPYDPGTARRRCPRSAISPRRSAPVPVRG